MDDFACLYTTSGNGATYTSDTCTAFPSAVRTAETLGGSANGNLVTDGTRTFAYDAENGWQRQRHQLGLRPARAAVADRGTVDPDRAVPLRRGQAGARI